MEKIEPTTEEGYRLAPYLLRFASASVDLALVVLSMVLLYFVCFPNGSIPTLGDALGLPDKETTLRSYQKASGLVKADADGNLTDIASSSYGDYESAIEYFYFVYNDPTSTNNPHPEDYSVKDFNVAVYDLPSDPANANHSAYYDFQTTDGTIDPNKLGVLKSSLYGSDGKLTSESLASLLTFYQSKYRLTQDLLIKESYYSSLYNTIAADIESLLAIMSFIPCIIFYFAIPMFSKFSRSLGKKWLHLAVIDVAGEPLAKWRLILRFLALALTLGGAIILDNLVLSVSLILLVFLVSMGLSAVTGKRRALHDYLAHSVVVREEDALFEKKAVVPNEEN